MKIWVFCFRAATRKVWKPLPLGDGHWRTSTSPDPDISILLLRLSPSADASFIYVLPYFSIFQVDYLSYVDP